MTRPAPRRYVRDVVIPGLLALACIAAAIFAP